MLLSIHNLEETALEAGVGQVAIYAVVTAWRISPGVYQRCPWHDAAQAFVPRRSDIERRHARVPGRHVGKRAERPIVWRLFG